MAGEKAMLGWMLTSALLAPIFWFKDQANKFLGGPIGFLSATDRLEMMRDCRVKGIYSVPGFYNQDAIELVTADRYPTNGAVIRIRYTDGLYTFSGYKRNNFFEFKNMECVSNEEILAVAFKMIGVLT